MRAAERMKELRTRLGLPMREVEEYSRRIAETHNNDEFFVSTPRLAQIENTDSTPSIYKLFSLSVIYRESFTELLRIFGVDLEQITRFQSILPLPITHVTDLKSYDETHRVDFPIRFDPGFVLERTHLLSRMVEVWGEIPIAMIQHLNVRTSSYGYIGSEDFTLYPLIRPGTLVQIDSRYKKVRPQDWRNEFDRPIYFLELRNEWICSWCEIHGKNLIVVPHPLSGYPIRQFTFPQDVEIVGRVTGIAMRIIPSQDQPEGILPKLPEQS